MALDTLERPDTDTDRSDNFGENPGQADWNNKVSRDLSSRENNAHSPSNNSGKSTLNDVNNSENTSSWKNNTSSPDRKKSHFGKNAMLKKFGPTGIIVGLLLGGGFGIGASTNLVGSLLIAVKENVVTYLDQQNFTSTTRTNLILAKQLTSDATKGTCSKIKFACRYERMSKYQVKQLKEAGVELLDKDGKVITESSILETKPDRLRFDGKEIKTSDFRNALSENATLRQAFRKAYNPRWVNWVDSKAVAFMKKIGVGKSLPSRITGAKDAKELQSATDSITSTNSQDANALKGELDNKIPEVIEKEGSKTAKSAGKSSRSGIAGSVLMASQIGCTLLSLPKIIVDVERAYRITQYSKLAYTFLTAADKIKKGEATPKEISNVATILTQTYKQKDGTIKKSAMDSSLMKYSIGLGTGGNDSKYIPSVGGAFSKYVSFVTSKGYKGTCDAISSDAANATALAVDVASDSTGFGAVANIAMAAVGTLGTWGVEKFLESDVGKSIIQGATSWVTNILPIDSLEEFFLGDLTKGANGVDIGDINAVSWSNSMADQASYTGNAPLTKEQKTAFDEQIVNPTRLAWAEEDRVSHSPFDISSPNTLLGSIAFRFVPYLGSVSSPLSFLSSISSISISSIFNITNPSAYAARSIDSNLCTQNKVLENESDIAIGPACDIQYGVPAEYMGIDPDQVIQELSDAGQIDNDTGEAKEDLKDWIDTCSQASVLNLQECTVTNRTRALYSLYQIDSRIGENMQSDPSKQVTTDSSDTTTASSSSSSDTSGAVGEPQLAEAQKGWGGYSNGEIPDSALASLSFASGFKMNKQAAASMEKMNTAYKKDTGSNLTINETYRTCARQIAYRTPGNPLYKGSTAAPAPPCQSNHGWGLAVDINVGSFGSATYNWLKANAHKYGYVHPSWAEPNGSNPEAWHWEYARKVS